MPISISVKGRFHQLAEFISDLASLPRIVTVGNMTISRPEGGGRELTMQAQLLTYQYLEDNTGERKEEKVRVQG